MTVIDPGHEYSLDTLDGAMVQHLVFVKREGARYPGNIGYHPGTTIQEVLRALIDRLTYCHGQLPCTESEACLELLKSALCLQETRAARQHGRLLNCTVEEIISGTGKCVDCGHMGCKGNCRNTTREP